LLFFISGGYLKKEGYATEAGVPTPLHLSLLAWFQSYISEEVKTGFNFDRLRFIGKRQEGHFRLSL